MRTSIHVSDQLLKQVLRETKARTITQAIRGALEGFLAHRRRVRLMRSFGSFRNWKPNIRAMRKQRDPG